MNIVNQIYNSIIILSFLNFIHVYSFKIVDIAYRLNYVFPFVFVLVQENIVLNILYPENNKEIINCFTSSVHAVILVVASYLFLQGIIDNSIFDNVLDYSLVYNIYDVGFILKHGSRIKHQMLFHHFLLVLCIFIKQYCDVPHNYSHYVALNFLSEITTIPLNYSWNLYLQNKTDTHIFALFNILTLVLYVPFRIILNLYLVYDQHYHLDTNLKYCQFLLMFLNFFWFYKMSLMVVKNVIKIYK